jgi:hypothetical protein
MAQARAYPYSELKLRLAQLATFFLADLLCQNSVPRGTDFKIHLKAAGKRWESVIQQVQALFHPTAARLTNGSP